MRRSIWIAVAVAAVVVISGLSWYFLSRPILGAGEFLVEDPAGDRMIIEVDLGRQEAIDALIEMHRTGQRKWVGGEIESFDNEFGFRFKPNTIIVADFTAEALQAVRYRTIQEDFTYWQGLGTVYIEGGVLAVPGQSAPIW